MSLVTLAEPKNNFKALATALELAQKQKTSDALATLEDWRPTESSQEEYKLFWGNLWRREPDAIWSQYLRLKKEKRLIRLRLELFNFIIKTDKPLASGNFLPKTKTIHDKEIKKEARIILGQLSGTSEGEIFEAEYLKWLQKNKFYDEICKTERRRWLSQPDIDYVEMAAGSENCPIKYDEFISRLRRLIFAAKESQAQREMDLYIESHESLKPWEKAYIRAVFNSHVGDPLAAFASLNEFESEILSSEYAENYFYISQRAGEFEKSEKILEAIIKSEKAHSRNADEMLFQRGFLFYQNKKYAEAFEIFNKLYLKHKFKKKKRKPKDFEQIAWLRAWVLFLDAKYEEALAAFESTRSYSSDPTRLNYWMAVSYYKLDHVLTAQQLFKKVADPVINNQTYGFYNLLSWVRYQETKKVDNKSQILRDLQNLTRSRGEMFPLPSEETTRSQILEFYSQILGDPTDEEQGEILVVNDENDLIFSEESLGLIVSSEEELGKHIEWAKFLIIQDQPELAKWHLYELEKNLKYSSGAKQLIQFYSDNRFYYRALSLSQRQSVKPKLSFEKDSFLLKFQYPEAYKDSTFKFSKKRDIDPYFMLSIMKAETQYKSDAISPVGAIGLMQFMPYTAEKVASLVDDNIKMTDLFDPKKSIDFGAAYLKKLFIEFVNQKPLVAAAYNGGPHRVKSWLKKLGPVDYDVFIEHIPFAETRTYVKRVLTFRSAFDKLYRKRVEAEDLTYLTRPIPLKLAEPISLKEEWEPYRADIKKTN